MSETLIDGMFPCARPVSIVLCDVVGMWEGGEGTSSVLRPPSSSTSPATAQRSAPSAPSRSTITLTASGPGRTRSSSALWQLAQDHRSWLLLLPSRSNEARTTQHAKILTSSYSPSVHLSSGCCSTYVGAHQGLPPPFQIPRSQTTLVHLRNVARQHHRDKHPEQPRSVH